MCSFVWTKTTAVTALGSSGHISVATRLAGGGFMGFRVLGLGSSIRPCRFVVRT